MTTGSDSVKLAREVIMPIELATELGLDPDINREAVLARAVLDQHAELERLRGECARHEVSARELASSHMRLRGEVARLDALFHAAADRASIADGTTDARAQKLQQRIDDASLFGEAPLPLLDIYIDDKPGSVELFFHERRILFGRDTDGRSHWAIASMPPHARDGCGYLYDEPGPGKFTTSLVIARGTAR